MLAEIGCHEMPFTEKERAYLEGQRLGRLGTIGPDGIPQLRPVSFQFNGTDGTVDVGGPDMPSTQKYRNLRSNPLVGFVIDDTEPDEPGAISPGWGRGVEIRGEAELVTVEVPPVAPRHFSHDVIRIHPRRIISWHLDPDNPEGEARNV